MKIVSFLAVAAVLGATSLAAAPAFAAPQSVGNTVPFCSTGNTSNIGQDKQELSVQLQLSTKLGSSVGCLEWLPEGHHDRQFRPYQCGVLRSGQPEAYQPDELMPTGMTKAREPRGPRAFDLSKSR